MVRHSAWHATGRWAFHVCRGENFAPGSITRAPAPTKKTPPVRITKVHSLKVTKISKNKGKNHGHFPCYFNIKRLKRKMCGVLSPKAYLSETKSHKPHPGGQRMNSTSGREQNWYRGLKENIRQLQVALSYLCLNRVIYVSRLTAFEVMSVATFTLHI